MTWEMNLVYRDDEGHTSSVTLNFPDSVTVANFAGAALAFQTVISPLTDAAFVKATISKVVAVAAATPVSGADIEIGARFIWGVTGTVKRLVQKIPAFVREKLVENSKVVDITDTDVADFIAAMEDGLTSVTLFQPSNTDGDDVAALVTAKETYSKARS